YRDKDYRRMYQRILDYSDRAILCTLPGSRSLAAKTMFASGRRNKVDVQIVSDPHQALQHAIQQTEPAQLIVVTGSIALVGLLNEDLDAQDLRGQEHKTERQQVESHV